MPVNPKISGIKIPKVMETGGGNHATVLACLIIIGVIGVILYSRRDKENAGQ